MCSFHGFEKKAMETERSEFLLTMAAWAASPAWEGSAASASEKKVYTAPRALCKISRLKKQKNVWR